jgi:ribosomal protein S18 acetylase RimI-like enzyme
MNTTAPYRVDNASPDDLPFICELFEQGIAFQKSRNYIGWNSYDTNYIRKDIDGKLLFKIIVEENILCVFSICFNDRLIWRDMEKGDAVYLHRIILNRQFAGSKAFEKVLEWSIRFARDKGLKHIRMDTWADNSRIIDFYKGYGFRFIENYKTSDTEDLPVQHRNLNVALLEYSL